MVNLEQISILRESLSKFGSTLTTSFDKEESLGCRIADKKERPLRTLDYMWCENCKENYSLDVYFHPDTIRHLHDPYDDEQILGKNSNLIFLDNKGNAWIQCSECKLFQCLTRFRGEQNCKTKEEALRYFNTEEIKSEN